MTWRELPPLATDVAAQLPRLENIELVAARIDDHTATLWPQERDAIARARERRVREFSTGRLLARCAMAALGAAECAIPRAEDRSPVWPDHLRGSITHAGDVAIAAAAAANRVANVGIDLEETERLTDHLFTKLFTHREIEQLQQADPRLPGLMFSAKEAGYKAVHPLIGRFIGFQEAEVDVSWPNRTLQLRYVGDHEPNRIMERGIGHFCFFEGYVLTVFVIPRD
jgi:4'-phosphopantetheinyl transferase EntD